MLHRIIRIAVPVAVALALLLEGGCVRTDVLVSAEGTPIAFDAGHKLLRDDAKAKSITENFTTNDDTFAVFGEKVTASNVHTDVFNGVTVHHTYEDDGDTDLWYYAPAHFWAWTSQSDRYDFVAVSPANVGSVKEETDGNLSVSTHYDYDNPSGDNAEGGDSYDILAATYRRTGTNWNRRYDRVELSFSHMGSAVCIVVANTSKTTSITVTSIYYKNLVVSADAKVSMNSIGQTNLRWTTLTRSAAEVRKLTKTPATTIGPQQRYEGGAYQIMIPQNLSIPGADGAELYLTYKVGNDPNAEEITSAPILLSSIQRADGTAITSWDIGYKYTYDVSMRLDGGLLVTVTTTPWDEPVQGETPGILI